MGQMEDFLATLSDEQKAAFAAALATEPKVSENPKRRGRPKKDKIILPKAQPIEDDLEEDLEPTERPKKKVIKIRMEEDDDEEESPRRKGARPKKRGNKSGGEKFCRTEGLNTGPRKNIFIDMEEFNADKHLVKEDKEALKKHRPAQRMTRATLYEVECVRCHREFEVGGRALAHSRYVCDGCITGRD
jgi:hypothetical protein